MKNTEHFDAFSSYKSLNKVLRLFSLSCIQRKGVKLKYTPLTFRYIFILLLLGIFNAGNVYFMFLKFDGVQRFKFLDFFELVNNLAYFQYIADLYFVHNYGGEIYLGYFRIYETIDRVIQMPYYRVTKGIIVKIMIIFGSLFFISIFFDYAVWYINLGWVRSTMYIPNYIYYVLKLLTVADVIANITQVEFRLKRMAELLQVYYVCSPSSAVVVKEVILFEELPYEGPNKLDILQTIYFNREYTILKLCGCYLLLLEQISFINVMFGFRILSTFTSLLIDMIMLLNLAIRILMGSVVEVKIPGWYNIASSALGFGSYCAIVFCVVHRCEQCYEELRNILRMVDLLLIDKNINHVIEDTLKEFRSLITSRPPEFHASNFFKLDYHFFVSMLTAIVTYNIILLQYLQ